jgi:peptidoglycan/LPS O-acetylase OafA/YrhL
MAFFAIFLYHVNPGPGFLGLQAGYLGVQAFFVLSGFLLTPILLDMQANLNMKDFFVHFYGRRALRIFPLYYFYLVIVTIISFLAISKYGHSSIVPLDRFIQQLPWTMTYTYDFFHASNHFEPTPFATHFWSLAVEEQFYLVWPLAIFFVPAQYLKRFLLVVILSGPFMRLLSGMILDARILPTLGQTDLAIYILPFSHVDAFAIGGYFALYGKSKSNFQVWLSILSVVAVGTVTSWLSARQFEWDQLGYAPFMKDSYKYIWGYSVVNLMFAYVLVHVRDKAFMTALFENRFLVYLGTISYGLYVFHFPILWMVYSTMYKLPIIVQILTTLIFTVLVSMASYELMEKRFINMKDIYFARASSGNVVRASAV